MKRPAPVILRGETRWFLSMLLAILLSVSAAANAFAEPFAYISNRYSDNISVIDTATNTVVATVAVGDGPFGVAVNPAGTRVYVANEISDTVSVIDTATNTVVATVAVGDGPIGVAVNPAGTKVYVTHFVDHGTVSVIDTATNTVVATMAVGSGPIGVGVNPAGTRVYVANHLSHNISVIDTATNTVVATVAVGLRPYGVAFNPAGTRVYVPNEYGNYISVIDTATNTVVTTATAGYEPVGVAVNPAGTRVYVANYRSHDISVIDTATNTVVATVAVGLGPIGVALNPAGTRVYVANYHSNNISVIDTATNTVVATVAVGTGPPAYGQFIRPSLVPQCVEPPSGLVSWWQGEGNADDIVNGNDGTLQGGATFAPGMVGQAFSFDGANDEVRVPYAANLNPTQALTLGAWVNANSLTNAANGGYQGVVSMSEGQRAYFFGITGTGSNHMGTAGNVHLEGFGLGSAWRTSAAVITPGQWYHIAGVIEPSTNRFEIYVNGVLQPVVGNNRGPQLASVSNVPFRIGFSDPGFPYHFNGFIDEVEIYNRALSASEIQAIFLAGSGGMCGPTDTTPPTTTATPSPGPNANGWNKTDVTVTLNATDDEGGSGVKEIHYALPGGPETVVSGSVASVTISAEGTTVLTYFAKDNAGNTEGAKNLTVQIDKQPPVVSVARTPAPNADGWNNTNVTVSFTATDTRSGIDGASFFDVFLTSEGANQSATRSFTDKAGNSASATVSINIDKTAPTITGTASPAPNAAGWNNTDVTVSFTCADGLSGIGNCGPTQVITTEGAGQSRMGTAVDKAGNSAPVTVSGINIDKTPPTVTYSGNLGTYTVDQTVSITCTASDNLSGVASTNCANISGPAYTFTLGTNTFSASATDLAGNTGTGSTSFTVIVTYESLRSLTRQFVGQRGILNSLEAKLNAAEAAAARGNAQAKAGAIGAFINELQAQAGKALTADQAAILIRLAQAL